MRVYQFRHGRVPHSMPGMRALDKLFIVHYTYCIGFWLFLSLEAPMMRTILLIVALISILLFVITDTADAQRHRHHHGYGHGFYHRPHPPVWGPGGHVYVFPRQPRYPSFGYGTWPALPHAPMIGPGRQLYVFPPQYRAWW